MIVALRIVRFLFGMSVLGQALTYAGIIGDQRFQYGIVIAIYTLITTCAVFELLRRIANHVDGKRAERAKPLLPRFWSL